MVINNYKFQFDEDGYIVGFYAVEGDDYDFTGQMAQHMDVVDSIEKGGYYKFVNGAFVLDEERKAQKEKEREEQLNSDK